MKNSALLTDLYQLTMCEGYFRNNKAETPVVFELMFRPSCRTIFAGLNKIVEYVKDFRFSADEIEYLDGLKIFSPEFLSYLSKLRFTGDIYAMREGTEVYMSEPVLSVKAPLVQAQLLETALLNLVNHSTMVAGRARELKDICGDEKLIEMGLRRAHNMTAGVEGSRAAYIGGFDSSSNVLAGQLYGIPVSGTMAHSWVMSFPDEKTAFTEYSKIFPTRSILLIDTYDTLKSGLPAAIEVMQDLKQKGYTGYGVRLDSGNLFELPLAVRKALDDADLPEAIICASGDLDANRIRALKDCNTPITLWGAGTDLITGGGNSAGGVYKLVECDKKPVIKISENPEKATYPYQKQVYRNEERDMVTAWDEVAEGEPMLSPIFVNGECVAPVYTAQEIREYCKHRGANSYDDRLAGRDGARSRAARVQYSDYIRGEQQRLTEESKKTSHL